VICGEAENGEDAVREVAKLLPDVLLLDASIALLHGVKVARIVKRDHPAVKVVMMSEQHSSVLARLAEAAGTPYFLAKSRLGIELIPLLTLLGEDSGNPKSEPPA
jgi:DNA-binding NarL/FixJ family response regulator